MEVTICILIMAIGVLGVATLFPISLMHSIKAHQLTSGTIHRYGAESFVDATKYAYRDPDRNGNELEHGTAANPWEGAWLFDPLGTSDPNPPATNPPTPPGFGLSAGVDAFENSPFPDNNNTIARYPGSGATDPRWTLPQADALAAAQDTWVERFVGSAGGNPPDTDPRDGQITIPNLREAGINPVPGAHPPTRAVMFYFDPLTGRRKSVTREINRIRQDVVQLDISTNPDPTLPAAVDEVRIETKDRRFSWLITVRRGGSVVGPTTSQHAAEMDVVVFFNRSFEVIDERVVWANFQNGSSTVDIRWTGDRPRLKRGSWILDANNGYWYQFSDFSESTNASQAQLTLVGSARAGSPPDATGNPDGRAVIMQGIVTVYGLTPPKSWISPNP